MLNKIISSVLLMFSFVIMPYASKAPDGLLFLFASPNKWVGTFRLALALVLFFISFKSLSKLFANFPQLRRISLISGLALIAFGLFSSLETSLGTVFYDYLKPLDLMVLLEAGIVATSMSLTTKVARSTSNQVRNAQKTTPKLLQESA